MMTRFIQVVSLASGVTLLAATSIYDDPRAVREAPVGGELWRPSISIPMTEATPREVREQIATLNQVLAGLPPAQPSRRDVLWQFSANGKSMAFVRRDVLTRLGNACIWPSWQQPNKILEFDVGVVEYLSNHHLHLGFGDDSVLIDLRAPEQETRIPTDLKSLRFANDNTWCAIRENLLAWGRFDTQTSQFEAKMTNVPGEKVILLRDGQYAAVQNGGLVSIVKRGGAEIVDRITGRFIYSHIDDAFVVVADEKSIFVAIDADGKLEPRPTEGMDGERPMHLSPTGCYLITVSKGARNESWFHVRATPRADPTLPVPDQPGGLGGWLAWE